MAMELVLSQQRMVVRDIRQTKSLRSEDHFSLLTIVLGGQFAS